jgi:hypothetical protein
MITFDKSKVKESEIEELVFETNVDDMQNTEDKIKLICSLENLK